MQAGKLSGGTHLDVLKGIGRDLLVRFLGPFQVELAANHTSNYPIQAWATPLTFSKQQQFWLRLAPFPIG